MLLPGCLQAEPISGEFSLTFFDKHSYRALLFATFAIIITAIVENMAEKAREAWVDRLRVTAIFMVLVVHATEPFYLGGEGSCVLTAADGFWVSFFDSFARACVPLFVIASSYLQFPLHYSTGEFFRRRFVRVIVPFVVWTAVYALIWGEPVENFSNLLYNFNYAAGHLWFVYMLVGIYLLMPLLSPWASKVSQKELLFYLCLCFFTTLIPFIRQWVGGEVPVIYGPSGIPNPAKYPLWGEASWNGYGLFYYFSGFIGYMLLGLYLRRFVAVGSWRRTLAVGVPVWLCGFAVCFGGFLYLMWADTGGIFPFNAPLHFAALWETPLLNDTAGVALMAFGWVYVWRKFSGAGPSFRRFVLPLSKASYGVYLCHIVILSPISGWFREVLGTGPDAMLGFWTTPVQIVCTAVTTFAIASLFCIIVGRIPRIGKYIVG